MSQESGPMPGLFSHTATPVPTQTDTPDEGKAQRPVFSSAPGSEKLAPPERDR